MLFGHASHKDAVFASFLFDSSGQSFNPELSEIPFLLFSAFVSMLSLFYQC